MKIKTIKVQNYRLLQNSTMDLSNQENDLSLIIGHNNSGKTSFVKIFEEFFKSGTPNFSFDDFPLINREAIVDINGDTNEYDLSIKLIVEIEYSEDDSLRNISDLILDLNPEHNTVKILFESIIDKQSLLGELKNIKDENKKRFINKNITRFLKHGIYVFAADEYLEDNDREKFVSKDKKDIDKLINFQVIHAKRNVSSSESDGKSSQVLSKIATSYFNKKTENQLDFNDLNEINKSLLSMDKNLEDIYKDFFKGLFDKSQDFLGITDLRVVSDLQSKEILNHHSKVVYGDAQAALPEHLNGLGYLNILYLILQLEIKKEFFKESKKDINLLFIEEPEAHTHPQMQTVFIEKIQELLTDIPNLQSFITTHSSHIVKNSDFKSLRYFSISENKIEIKNFYTELKSKYEREKSEDEFTFLNQYLTIASAELFFAKKIIFIEGLTERLLLPYFIKQFDNNLSDRETKLSSQNISILEVGANAKAFKHFIDFLKIKTLIITDIDTTQKTIKEGKTSYPASSVIKGTHTSNASIKYFLNAPKITEETEFKEWFKNLKSKKLNSISENIEVAYQTEQDNYHGRSFEEAFIHQNKQLLIDNINDIRGLKNNPKEKLESSSDIDAIVDEILDKKSDFASSILWLALTKDIKWSTPLYIKQALEWIQK